VTVHPEKVQILIEEDRTLNLFRGKITDVVYLGEITKYHVTIPNGQVILAKHHNLSSTKTHHVGDNVFVGWAIDDCGLVT
jgi:putrescine transport system ATP-binding protein